MHNKRGSLFLRGPYSSTRSPDGVLTPGVGKLPKLVKRRVAPLDHVVRPKGNVTQGKHKEVSGTLGAPNAS